MQAQQDLSELQFVNLHVVDKNYHELHSQLLHKHEDVLELFYIMQGDGQYIVGGKEYIIRPGNLVICNEDILHGEAPFCSREMESYCCVVRGLHLPELPPNTLTRPTQNPTLYFSEDRTAVEHILHALCDLNRHTAVHQAACNALSAALVTLVYDKLEQRQQTNSITHRNNEEFIQNVTHYLDQHFMESLQLPELGERFHISHYYLSRLFKAETGLSPMKYVMYRKIGESQNLLMNTELPIGTISDRMALDAVKKAGVKLQIGFVRRFDHNHRGVYDAVRSGKIGTPHILRISSRDPQPPTIAYVRRSGGIFYDMMIHDFDMIHFLAGCEVTEVYAKGAVLVDPAIGAEGDVDTAIVTLTFENGAIGVIDNSRQAVYGYDQRLEVFGSEGAVQDENDIPNTVVVSRADGTSYGTAYQVMWDRYTRAFIDEMKAFADSVIHDKVPPVTDLDGLYPVLMAAAANKSLKEGRPVKISEVDV